ASRRPAGIEMARPDPLPRRTPRRPGTGRGVRGAETPPPRARPLVPRGRQERTDREGARRMSERHASSSPEETERIAAELAAKLEPGDVVTVSGDLGSGKTTFVRGACRALGVHGHVTSPTFTIGHVLGESPEVAHLDLYRLGSLAGEGPGLPREHPTPEPGRLV